MAWHLSLGIDEKILNKVNFKDKKRQLNIFSLLSLMLVVIGILVFISAINYMLVIFHSWPTAIATGLFISAVVFNIYRFIIVSSINATGTGISDYHIHHDKVYERFFDNSIDFKKMTEEQILEIVNNQKDDLRDQFYFSSLNQKNKFPEIFTMTIRVVFIALFAIIFSTGLELFLFKNEINQTLAITKAALMAEEPNSWMLNHVLTPRSKGDFVFLNSNSLLLLIDVLNYTLGNWKLGLDLIILIIFLIPLILVFKSQEILKGPYTREMALHEISISFYHFLKSQQYCQILLEGSKNKRQISQ